MELIFILLFLAIMFAPLIFTVWFAITVIKRLNEISCDIKRITDILEEEHRTQHNSHSYHQE